LAESDDPIQAISVAGWSLSDGANVQISLSGTIPARSQVVLERTSDASAAGTAFTIYTGALSNAGATLTLKNGSGTTVDQVVGGSDWSAVGGDNQTKETAQRTAVGWRTAMATPGQGLGGQVQPVSSVVAEDETDSSAEPTANSPATRSRSQSAMTLTLPDVTLELEVSAPTAVHVSQPTEFTVTPTGVGDTIADSLQYIWNFGDGEVGTGETATHQFSFPGRYVVVVEGIFKRQQYAARFEIEVLPVTVELERNHDNSVTLTNSGDQELLLSEYRLVDAESFQFPPHSILLPGQEITIGADKLGSNDDNELVVLYDQANRVAAMVRPSPRAPEVTTAGFKRTLLATAPTQVAAPAPRISAVSSSRVVDQSPPTMGAPFTFASAEDAVAAPINESEVSIIPNPETQIAATRQMSNSLPENWTFYALVGLLVLVILAIYFMPKKRGDT